MAFQTNVFRHGEWVTETVDLQAVLKANSNASAKPLRQRAAHPPECGILTRTVIESPVANWILPVRLRSAQHMDVAFIGDHYVQISELGEDGQLRDIIRKTDFGSRIRNAKVIGPPPDSTRDDTEVKSDDIMVKVEEGAAFSDDDTDVAMSDAGVPLPPAASPSRLTRLPPQQLMIVLESGDCVFLFVRQGVTGEYEFFDTRVDIPNSQIAQPGFHAAVDPSSRYMALACPENLFVVYELESKLELNRRYARGEPLRPIKSFRARMVNGVIHKMEFLYPHPDDDYHIILLLIIVMHGKSRMVTYEWGGRGDDLVSVLSEAKRGQPLPPQHQIPLLIIPLTVHSAFFAISARRIAVCKDALTLPAEFDDFVMDVQETSRFHHGSGEPLWAAWTRPYRLPTYRTTRDNIYLAREDGVVMFLEIDSDNILGASVQIGKFDCNIGTSFCSLLDDFNDILIMGGDSGPGSICQIRPRKPNIPLGTIPNWSPVVDFVTNDKFSAAVRLVGEAGNKIIPWQDRPLGSFSNPDRIFATSGHGVTGAVTEFRFGYRANIGLDIDYETPVKQSWIFPTQPESADPEFHLLMSLVDRTVVLYLSSDLEKYREPDADLTQYDLSTRTVAAAQMYEDAVVQVSEKYLVFISPMTSVRRLHADIFQDSQVTVVDAFIQGNLVAVSTNVGVVFRLYIVQLDASGTIKTAKSYGQMGEVTCLCLATVEGSPYLVAGLLKDSHPSLVLYNVGAEGESALCVVDVNSTEISKLRCGGQEDAARYPSLEPLTSVLLKKSEDGSMAIVFGTRGGDMVALTIGLAGSVLAANSEKLGRTATHVVSVEDPNLKTATLAVCDGRLSLMSDFDARRASFRSMHTVWLEDASDTSKESPFVSAASVLQKSLPGHQSKTQLTLTAKTRVLLVELHTQPRPVHRSLPVMGTPLKVIYSCMLDCLIVALKTLDDKPTLQFLDPDTGEDLSFPTDKYNEPVEFVSGLGKTGDHILGLDEWQYERNGDKWLFLLVSTKGGRLLVLSTVPVAKNQEGRRQKIRYWTRYKRSTATEPIYSVVGWNNNVFYCMGSTLYWDQLDVEDRRLRTQGTFELASSATSLRILNGRIVALTERDSVEIISMTGENPGEMTLHHADSESRTAVHMIEIGDKTADGSGASAVLLSNRSCGVAGLFIPWQQPGRDCEVILEAELPASIRKLARGRTRPVWQQARRDVRYGLLPSTLDGAEILGMCIDGSLQHFTLLSIPIWRILRLIQNLAFTTPTLYPFLYEVPGPDFDEEPEVDQSYGMQIDGDMLQRCLDKRALEELFSSASRTNRLFELLEQLDNGRWTAAIGKSSEGREEDRETEPGMEDGEEGDCADEGDAKRKKKEEKKSSYLALLYDILEYYLAPVL
ncbi:thermotolerance protein [Grosmannia clavigera kw1407]|uniref:Thermotolerance protein n=1 Tax=Grosmannia clavigera (strain kw1407 / UAMH 11150) TaxID=655863 RepID=F0X8Y6_GROCL|nr:thermotolerance protein [Grosmannia clavigera kw1407]EFX05596.1 thermotolerance protein [Grosmannia clavigera kw1407]